MVKPWARAAITASARLGSRGARSGPGRQRISFTRSLKPITQTSQPVLRLAWPISSRAKIAAQVSIIAHRRVVGWPGRAAA
jgi:hypothetical protein